jgi:hypothetical protein
MSMRAVSKHGIYPREIFWTLDLKKFLKFYNLPNECILWLLPKLIGKSSGPDKQETYGNTQRE